jgi:hypothetical protein
MVFPRLFLPGYVAEESREQGSRGADRAICWEERLRPFQHIDQQAHREQISAAARA